MYWKILSVLEILRKHNVPDNKDIAKEARRSRQ